MSGKQAKVLTDKQIKAVLGALGGSRNGLRNKVMFLLSLHGLRSKEVASIEISMVTDSSGAVSDHITLEDKASKGKSGRVVYISNKLKETLVAYLKDRGSNQSKYLITTERSEKFSPNAVAVFFHRLYSHLGFNGMSSHSGRRTFITKAARKLSQVGGSLRDLQLMAGHKNLATTQRYIDYDTDAQKKLIQILY
jgi:integrase